MCQNKWIPTEMIKLTLWVSYKKHEKHENVVFLNFLRVGKKHKCMMIILNFLTSPLTKTKKKDIKDYMTITEKNKQE